MPAVHSTPVDQGAPSVDVHFALVSDVGYKALADTLSQAGAGDIVVVPDKHAASRASSLLRENLRGVRIVIRPRNVTIPTGIALDALVRGDTVRDDVLAHACAEFRMVAEGVDDNYRLGTMVKKWSRHQADRLEVA